MNLILFHKFIHYNERFVTVESVVPGLIYLYKKYGRLPTASTARRLLVAPAEIASIRKGEISAFEGRYNPIPICVPMS
jgi:hypothetical protein